MLRAWKQENKDKPRSCPTSLLLYSVMVSRRPVPAGLRWCPMCINTVLTVAVWPPMCDMLPLLVLLGSQDQGLL